MTQTGDILINGEKHNGTSYKVIPEQLLGDESTDTEPADTEAPQDGAEPTDTNAADDGNGNGEGQDKQEALSYTSLHIHTVSSNIELNTAPEPEEVPGGDTAEGTDNG